MQRSSVLPYPTQFQTSQSFVSSSTAELDSTAPATLQHNLHHLIMFFMNLHNWHNVTICHNIGMDTDLQEEEIVISWSRQDPVWEGRLQTLGYDGDRIRSVWSGLSLFYVPLHSFMASRGDIHKQISNFQQQDFHLLQFFMCFWHLA